MYALLHIGFQISELLNLSLLEEFHSEDTAGNCIAELTCYGIRTGDFSTEWKPPKMYINSTLKSIAEMNGVRFLASVFPSEDIINNEK